MEFIRDIFDFEPVISKFSPTSVDPSNVRPCASEHDLSAAAAAALPTHSRPTADPTAHLTWDSGQQAKGRAKNRANLDPLPVQVDGPPLLPCQSRVGTLK